MNSRVFGIDESTAELRLLLEENPELATGFQQRYEVSWLVHDNALDGLVLSEEDIDGAFGQHVIAEGSALATITAVRNHRAILDRLREAVEAKRGITLPFLVSLYETLLRDTHANAKLRAVFRKDIPLHRSYFHAIVEPERVEEELASWVESLESAEFRELHPIRRAAVAHWEFMRVFPFAEHNGRIARLVHTYFLLDAGYFPPIIHASDRQRYYESLGQSASALRHILLDAMENCLENSVRSLRALGGSAGGHRRLAR